MHIFSMNCKADAVAGTLADAHARRDAIKAFRELGITKVYVESYRTKLFIPEALLRAVKRDFESAGFEVCGCIVPTQMSERLATGWSSMTCFSDESAHRRMQEVVERTASVFDTILFDDFLFTRCTCSHCQAAKGDRSWGEYRTDLLMEIARERIVKPARAVNRNVTLIIKYPCWYDGFFSGGYDVLRGTALFDLTWAGTETRNPDRPDGMPQYKAFWLQNWLNALGKCGGGWYDPLDCSPETFVEQARNTILGGAKESLLHCYDYLFLGASSVAKDGGGLSIPKNDLAARAFQREAAGLRALAALVEPMTPYGVAAPKRPNCDQGADSNLHGFAGMLGIPLVATTTLETPRESFLSAHCAHFDNAGAHVDALCASRTPFMITRNAVAALKDAGKAVNGAILDAYERCEAAGTYGVKAGDAAHVLRFEKPWDLMALEPLDELRNSLLSGLGMELYAPSRVGLQLFRDGERLVEVIQNFNDSPVDIRLKFNRTTARDRRMALALPADDSASLSKTGDGEYVVSLKARSLIALA